MKRRSAGKLWCAVAAALAVSGSHALGGEMDLLNTRVALDSLNPVWSSTTINSHLNLLDTNPASPTYGKFTDLDYTLLNQNGRMPCGAALTRLRDMAAAWASPTHPMYQSSSLRDNILLVYNDWVTNNYLSTANWFYNSIGNPSSLARSMMVMGNSADSGTGSFINIIPGNNYPAALAILEYPAPSNSYTGANLTALSTIEIQNGLIRYFYPGASAAEKTAATARVTNAFASVATTIPITTGEGVQPDMSYKFHGSMLYTGGYGNGWIQDMGDFAKYGAGTSLGFTTQQVNLVIDAMLDGTQPTYRSLLSYEFGTVGRFITNRMTLSSSSNGIATTIANLMAASPGYRAAELTAFKSRLDWSFANGGLANPSNNYSGSKVFWNSDYAAHNRAGFLLGVKVISNRTEHPEVINGQNLKGLYNYYGLNTITVRGNEYQNIQPFWDWYRLPGVTSERGSNGLGGGYSLLPSGNYNRLGSNAYAGGASNGVVSTVGYDYRLRSPGSGVNLNLSAKKGWFFFDKGQVALGSAITQTTSAVTGNIVGTTINQSLLNGAVVYSTSPGSQTTLATNSSVTPGNLRWVNHDNVGYFFLTPVSNATIRNITQSGSWYSVDSNQTTGSVSGAVFSLDLSHGVRPSGAFYEYVVIPGLSAAQMDAYVATNPFTIVANTATVQAVAENLSGITQANFYAPGSITLPSTGWTLAQTTSGQGSSLIWAPDGAGGYTLSVASPEQLTNSLSFSISTRLSGGGANTSWNWQNNTTTVTLAMPTSAGYAGSTVSQSLRPYAPTAKTWTGVGGVAWNATNSWSSAGAFSTLDHFAVFPSPVTGQQPFVSAAASGSRVAWLSFESPAGGYTLGAENSSTFLVLDSSGVQVTNQISGTTTIGVGLQPYGDSLALVAGSAVSGSGTNYTVNFTGRLNSESSYSPGVAARITVVAQLGEGTGNRGVVNLSGPIVGPGSLLLSGAATGSTITLTGSSSFTGGTTLQGANVTFGSLANSGTNSALGSAGLIQIGNSGEASTLTYTGATTTSNRQVLFHGAGVQSLFSSGTGPINLNAAGTLVASGGVSGTMQLGGTNTGSNTLAGSIRDTGPAGSTSLSKVGTGQWVLTGSNSYSGPTTITSGTLALSGSLRDTAITVVNGGTFTQSGSSVISGASSLTLIGTTMLGPSNTFSGTVNLQRSNITLSSLGTSSGASPSSLGQPVDGVGQIRIGSANFVVVRYVGTGETSDRPFLTGSGVGGNGSIQFVQSGTGTLRLTGDITHSGNVLSRSFFLDGSTAGVGVLESGLGDYVLGASRGVISLVKQGTGTWTLAGSNSFSGGVSITGGRLIAATPLRPVTGALTVTGTGTTVTLSATGSPSAMRVAGEFSSITIAAGASVAMPAADRSVNRAGVLVTSGLSLAGTLRLGTGDLIFRGGAASLAAVRAALVSGALTSSATPGAAPFTALSLFVNDAGDGVTPYFSVYDGVTGLAAGDLIVKYTYVGDTNLDGTLDGNDLTSILEGFSTGQTGWARGDVDHSGGPVSVADVNLALTAYSYYQSNALIPLGDGQGGEGSAASVPEPSQLLALPVALLATRRHRVRRAVRAC